MNASYIAEVIADNSMQWVGNGLRFATAAEANAYAQDLAWRWTLVQMVRVVPSMDPVNSRWADRVIRLDLVTA